MTSNATRWIVRFVLFAILCRAAASAVDGCDCEPGGSGKPKATLVDAEVTLCTTSADKDRDTRLEIWIDKDGGKQVAYLDLGRSEKMMDGSSKVYDVPKQGRAMRRSELPASQMHVRITPLGHDSWRFKAKAVLNFTDGSSYQKCFGETVLDRDARTGVYPLN